MNNINKPSASMVDLMVVLSVLCVVAIVGIVIPYNKKTAHATIKPNFLQQYANEQQAIGGYKNVSNAFITDMQNDQPAKAYALTSKLFQEGVSNTEADVAKLFGQIQDKVTGKFTQSKQYSTTTRDRNFVAVQYKFSGNNQNYALIILEENAGQWRADSFQVGPNNYSVLTALQVFVLNYPWNKIDSNQVPQPLT